MRTIKPWWLVLGFLFGFLCAVFAEELIVHWKDDSIQISAPQFHFLAGRALDRLHNGATVPFDFQLSVWVEDRTHLHGRSQERYIVSYDLWEDRFSVVSQVKSPRKSVSRLTAAAAEAWCLDHISVPVSGLGPDEKLWVHLEVRAGEPREASSIFGRGSLGESGISLTKLIEIFSRPPHQQQAHWSLEAGPLRLADIKQANGRGS